MHRYIRPETQIIRERRVVQRLSQRCNRRDRELLETCWKNTEHFRLITESMGDVVCTMDMNMKPTYVNSSVKQLLGYTVEEAYLKKMEEIFTEQSYDSAMDVLADEMKKGLRRNQYTRLLKDINLDLIHKNGSVIEVEVRSSLIRKPSDNEIEILAVARDVAGQKKRLELIEDNTKRLVSTLECTITAIAMVGESKDPYTAGHQRRVSNIACYIARVLHLPEKQINGLRLAALTHDIGKVRVPTEILIYPGKLTGAEMDIIKQHPTTGYNILKNVRSPWPIAEIVYQHHERINGSGYPRGLTGENILKEAKILAVADVFEAMLAHRPYRPPLSVDIALQELTDNIGKLYDGNVVQACLKLIATDNTFLDRVMKDTYNFVGDLHHKK